MIDELSDSELVAGLRKGRLTPKAVVGVLYERHSKAVFHYALQFFPGDTATADDVMQGVFVSLVTESHEIGALVSVKGWLLGVTKNKAIKLQEKLRPALFGDGLRRVDTKPSPGEARSRHVTAVLMRRAALDLPEKERVVFHLRVDTDKTFAEVAELMECSENTAKNYMQAARARLRAVAEKLGVI